MPTWLSVVLASIYLTIDCFVRVYLVVCVTGSLRMRMLQDFRSVHYVATKAGINHN
jgi:hypothetical protein